LTGKLTILILNLTFGISSVVIRQKILKKLEESYFSEWLALENLTSGNAENGAIHKSMRFQSWLDSKKHKSLEDTRFGPPLWLGADIPHGVLYIFDDLCLALSHMASACGRPRALKASL
jgi:hypothetical protein